MSHRAPVVALFFILAASTTTAPASAQPDAQPARPGAQPPRQHQRCAPGAHRAGQGWQHGQTGPAAKVDPTVIRKDREYFYNGRSFTINAPRTGYYATVRAPATIARLVNDLSARFGIQLPLADLFYWGTPRARTDLITSAIDVGPSTIDGVATEQYALRQPGLD